MAKKFIILVIIIFGSIPVLAQSVDTAWVRIEPESGGYPDLALDASCNVYVTGGGVTIKYNTDGNCLWRHSTSGANNTAIALDSSGSVYVTAGYILGYGDYATIKYYPNGDTAWRRRYEGPGNSEDWAFDIAVDAFGNACVTGYSWGGATGFDYATVKYYPNGDTAWVRRYNGPGVGDKAFAIKVDGSCNVYVTGWSEGSGTITDYATIKYYPNGDTAWVRRYNRIGSSSADVSEAIAIDAFGNVYVTGESFVGGTGTGFDYATVKYDRDGRELWVKIYNGPGNGDDGAWAIALDDSNNVYVTGGSEGDYATIKYYPNGDTAWVTRYNGRGTAYDIAVDAFGNVYVTGRNAGAYTTIKYVQTPVDVKDETGKKEKPFEFALSQNYPNPFNPTTTIKFKVWSLENPSIPP